MYIKGENKVVDNLLEKCEEDMKKLKEEMIDIITGKKESVVDYTYYAYKITMYKEILDMLKCNGAEIGVGYFAKLYGNDERPLNNIYDDMISLFTEPRLMTKNKMWKLLDKKGV